MNWVACVLLDALEHSVDHPVLQCFASHSAVRREKKSLLSTDLISLKFPEMFTEQQAATRSGQDSSGLVDHFRKIRSLLSRFFFRRMTCN